MILKDFDLVNLCPHDVKIIADGQEVVIPATGEIARCNTRYIRTGEVNGIPLYRMLYAGTYGLPEQKGNTFYITSQWVWKNNKSRDDILVPAEKIKDGKYIEGVTGLAIPVDAGKDW